MLALAATYIAGGRLLSNVIWMSLGALLFSNLAGYSFLLAAVFFLAGLLTEDKRGKEYISSIKSSDEYRAQCEKVDHDNEKALKAAQAEADRRYESALSQYRDREIPDYQRALAEFNETSLFPWKVELRTLREQIQEQEALLQKAYSEIPIPRTYRNIIALEFIVSYMESSKCDIEQALEAFERAKIEWLARAAIDSDRKQRLALQNALERQESLTNTLQEQLEEIKRESHKAKQWGMTGAALAGYAAYRASKKKA